MKCLKCLDDNGDLPRDGDGLTPLHWACDRGHVPLAQAILETFPGQVNTTDTSQQTPLHYGECMGLLDTLLNVSMESNVSVFVNDEIVSRHCSVAYKWLEEA